MAEHNSEDLRNLDSVKAFVAAAERYCTLLENHKDYMAYEFLREVANALASLYLAALNLQEPELDEEDEPPLRVTYEPKDFSAIRTKLGQYDIYSLVYDPYDTSRKENITFTVTSDLTEIYHDLSKYFNTYREGTLSESREALWQWQFQFEIHWGLHILHVLHAIHWLISDSQHTFKPKEPIDWDDLEQKS